MTKSLLSVAVSQLIDPTTGNTRDPMDVTTQGKPQKTAKIPAYEMSLQQHDAMTDADLSVYFPDLKQRELIEDFAVVAEDQRYSNETAVAEMARIAKELFPTGRVTYHQARTVNAFLKNRSKWAYECMVKAIKSFPAHGAKMVTNKKTGKTRLVLGKLPSRDGGFKAGKRGPSLATWQSTNAKTLKAMRQKMQASKKVIDPKALDLYADMFALWDKALKQDRKAS